MRGYRIRDLAFPRIVLEIRHDFCVLEWHITHGSILPAGHVVRRFPFKPVLIVQRSDKHREFVLNQGLIQAQAGAEGIEAAITAAHLTTPLIERGVRG